MNADVQPKWPHIVASLLLGLVALVALADFRLPSSSRRSTYARQLTNAEEHARRATAVDSLREIHGITQCRVGIVFPLGRAKSASLREDRDGRQSGSAGR